MTGEDLETLEAAVDRRLEERLAAAPDRLAVRRAAVQATIALGSIGLGVVFALVARELGDLGGTLATLVAWAAILAVNVVHARR